MITVLKKGKVQDIKVKGAQILRIYETIANRQGVNWKSHAINSYSYSFHPKQTHNGKPTKNVPRTLVTSTRLSLGNIIVPTYSGWNAIHQDLASANTEMHFAMHLGEHNAHGTHNFKYY